jgi:hypothetical protein
MAFAEIDAISKEPERVFVGVPMNACSGVVEAACRHRFGNLNRPYWYRMPATARVAPRSRAALSGRPADASIAISGPNRLREKIAA